MRRRWLHPRGGWTSYAHYQYVSLAPACLGWGLLVRFLPSQRAKAVSLALLLTAGLIVGVQTGRLAIKDRSRRDVADEASVREYAQSHFGTEDCVLFWLWRRSSNLLYQIDRSPGTRHFLAHAYLELDDALFSEFVNSFAAASPDWIIEDDRRNKPSLSGPLDPPPDGAAADVKRLQEFVRGHYATTASFGHFHVREFVGRRRGTSPAASMP